MRACRERPRRPYFSGSFRRLRSNSPHSDPCTTSADRIGFFADKFRKSARSALLMQLKLTTRTVQDILVVNCDGRIVFGEESAELRDKVKALIAQNKRIILNL